VAAKLIGHSGCQLEVVVSAHKTFVKKVSKDILYNERFVSQIKKQVSFKDSLLKTPEVHQEYYSSEGLFTVVMEYVPGVTFNKYIETASVQDIIRIADVLAAYMATDSNVIADNFLFEKKINELENNSLLINNRIFKNSLAILKKQSWSLPESGNCHGDLTFENIIIFNNSIYLIDFLDSFYSDWRIDLSKIYQDTIAGWSHRHEQLNQDAILRIEIFHQALTKSLVANGMSLNDFKSIYYLLMLNLLRIVPYSAGNLIVLKHLESKLLLIQKILPNLEKIYVNFNYSLRR
jgi:tRNA A-37 threonylcarbamoyl transferase component Bud32